MNKSELMCLDVCEIIFPISMQPHLWCGYIYGMKLPLAIWTYFNLAWSTWASLVWQGTHGVIWIRPAWSAWQWSGANWGRLDKLGLTDQPGPTLTNLDQSGQTLINLVWAGVIWGHEEKSGWTDLHSNSEIKTGTHTHRKHKHIHTNTFKHL